jgi:Phosphoesterase family/PASTA domain
MLPSAMGGTGGSNCANNLVPLFGSSDQLNSDLQSASTTPDLSFIVPDNCNNGHDAVCQGNNLSGESAGYPTYNSSTTIPAAANSTGGTYAESQFLSIVIPEIEASPAFQDNGMIAVTYDEAYPPFTYSNDSQANSQLQNPDAAGSLTNDSAGETLYGRSLSWEPTGPNATIVTAPSGQVLTAGPGDSAYLDRPTSADGDLVACTEPTLDPTGGSGTDAWVTFTAPTGSNGDCIPGFQANGYRPATPKTTPSLTIASGSSTVPYTAATDEIQGMQVTSWNAGTPTLTDGANNNYTGNVYVGSVADTPQTAASSSSAAFTGAFTLVDQSGSPVTVNAGYTGTLTLTSGDTSTDPFYDAFDATLGGGDSGAVLISPYITPGTVSNTYYNHYSLLRTLEDAFGLQNSSVNDTGATGSGAGYLGFASQPGLAPLGSDVFTNVTTPPTTQTQTVTNTATVTQTQTQTTTVSNPGGTTTVTTPGNTRTVTDVKSVVPYLSGYTLGKAKSAISADKLKLGKVKGSGAVASESPRAGTVVKTGTKVSLTLRK